MCSDWLEIRYFSVVPNAGRSSSAGRFDRTGKPVRLFGEFRYAAETWPRRCRVVVKAEHLPKGANPRFVVTSLQQRSPPSAYALYCQRGQMNNWIKDLKNVLHGDRLSCTRYAANWFRLLLHGTAYRLLHALRQRLGQQSAELGRLQLDTLRLRLIKVAAIVTQSVRRILVRLARAYPWISIYAALAESLDPAPT
jgi:hypothetical protein